MLLILRLQGVDWTYLLPSIDTTVPSRLYSQLMRDASTPRGAQKLRSAEDP